MEHITNPETGRFRRFIMDESEYHELNNNYIGLCTACGAERYCTEPDAEKYDCEECERPAAYGVEQLMLMGRIVLES